jgi:CubicO group peptidase (beta-lactamase class C family)
VVDPLPASLASVIRARLRQRRTQGLALCCFDREQVRVAGGVGLADVERGEPVTPATVFRVASISKLVTTALVLSLVDDGAVDLDAAANQYLPPSAVITDPHGLPATSPVRTLLSHTSGLPAGTRGADVGNPVLSYLTNHGRVRNLADAVDGLQLSHDPGDRLVYSNPAFNVAGHLAATALGQQFEAAAQERILEPLGMSGAEFTPRRHGRGVATPYGSILPPGVGPASADRMRLVATPMGGLTASVMDLARFGQMVLNQGAAAGRQILSREVMAESTSMQARNHVALEQGYGLGFKVRTWRGRTTVGHDGNMPGVATQLLLSPEDGMGVVVLTNGYALAVPHEIAEATLEHVLGLGPDPEPTEPDRRRDWEDLGRRVEGDYRFWDPLLPGLVGRLGGALTRIRVAHESSGRLRVDGNPGADGPAWLLPDGELGTYRVAADVDDRTNAVIEERPDGVHLWLGHTTRLHRRS